MRVTLDGQPIPIDGGAAWTLKEGTAPHIAEFVFESSVAEALFRGARVDGSELIFDPRGATNMRDQLENRISKLTILGTGPADNPGERTVTVADRRWRLKRQHVYRAYNLRRKTGRRRRVQGQSQTVATSTLADDVAYAQWTIKADGKAWSSREIVADLMNRIFGRGQWSTTRGADGKEPLAELPPIEGLEIDLPADAALGVLLQQIGGAVGLTVNHQGRVFLYPRFDNAERRMLGIRTAGATIDPQARRAIVGGPLAAAQDRSMERPRAVRVLFTRVAEIRIDSLEPTDSASATDPDPLPPRMTNVIASPEDFEHDGVSYVVGQWLPIATYFDYLGSAALKAENKLNAQNPISFRTVNRAWLSGYLDGYGHPRFDSSGVWSNRINAIKTHYRLTYQVDRPWRDRIRELDPYRVSIQDYETGSRAPATVFANHAVFSSWRALGRSASDPPRDWETIQNRFANPTGNGSQGSAIVGADQSDLKSAPAFASIVDQDQGIVRIEYDTGNDVTGQFTRIVRSALTRDSMPTDNAAARNQYLQHGRLESDHEVSVILTAKLGAPAGNRRFHVVEINADEGQQAAKLPGFKRGRALGPVIEVRVPPTLEPARFAWDDQRSDEFSRAFEIDPTDPDADITGAFGQPINEDQVREVALATAARVYHKFVDRAEGGITTPMVAFGQGGLFSSGVRGVVDKIEIRADPSRGLTTTITVPDEAPDLAFEALLPPQYRKLIGRMVDLGD